ncbi:NUDIX hydrolase [Halobacillus salinus]|uniref:NUDIX domain-containing protein n=1 Tax=Halobacillus salinus TaxID=192814 RepID=A0A4Z0GUM7_9BACI|nr:NUDIX hydrolase [Halobacillus salinus]TGB01221.1 NUDIX domain-containing protein [Halobacillus salinus]
MDIRFQIEQTRFNYRAAGILIEDDHILFHRQQKDSYWALPGGGVEIGESTNESIVREWREELGEDITVASTLWVTENFFTYKQQPLHELAFYYLVQRKQGKVQTEPFSGKEGDRLIYQWLPLRDLHHYDIRPTFLHKRLNEIPDSPEHLILKGES